MKRKVGLVLLCLAIQSQIALAESFVFELPYEVEPRNAAAFVVSNERFQKLPVDMRKTPTGLKLTVDIADAREEDLVTTIVTYQNGQMASIPLHVPSKGELSSESQRAVDQRIKSLQGNIDKGEKEISQLTRDMNQANFTLREKAGLKDVNAVYLRIGEVEGEIAKIKTESKGY